MNDLKFVRANGGFNRQLAGTDHISLLLMNGVATTGATELDCTSIDEALAQGLLPADVLLWYHISEFFRLAPGARLIVKSLTVASTTYAEIKALQTNKGGVIKQVGIWDGTIKPTVASIQAINNLCKELADMNMPLQCLLSPRLVVADYATLLDCATCNAEFVSQVIGHDPSGYGTLKTASVQCGIIGAALGALASSQVHTSLAWVERQNLVTGFYKDAVTNQYHPTRELDKLGFVGGNLYSDFTPAQIDVLDAKGYIFMRKHVDIAGSYFNHSRTCAALTSDYLYLENVRTMNKACRAVYKDLAPKLSSPIYIDSNTGYIADGAIASLEAIAETGLAQMERDGELSAQGYGVFINPNQNILTTSKLAIKIRAIPVGVLRQLEVNIGFALKLN
jgi:hypothetical protein